MRRIVTILLLAFAGLPMAAPLLAAISGGEAGVPVCCRRSGRHHCEGGAEMVAEAGSKAAFGALKQACPYAPTLAAAVHHDTFAALSRRVSLAAWQTQDAVVAQTECKLRIARSRSRQKRGPPTSSAS